QPTSKPLSPSRIPPTESVDPSYPAYIKATVHFPNPTDGVGGFFIPSLHQSHCPLPESHRRSRWILHTRPTSKPLSTSPIPPTESVDFSYPAYITATVHFPNPTDGVGGSFIPGLHQSHCPL